MQEKIFPIYTAPSRFTQTLYEQTLTWSIMKAKLREPVRTEETAGEYAAMKREQQLKVKDVGGYVGGTLRGGRRTKRAVEERTLVTLDYDSFSPEMLERLRERLDCAWAVHSTHKHREEAWRVRIVICPSRPLLPDEYAAVCRRIAEMIGMEGIDRTTAEPERLMFWPSVSKDAPYLYEESATDRPMDVAAILGTYRDWKDASQWPRFPEEERVSALIRTGRRQGNGADSQADPLEKKGAVGAFCRAYDIHRAISEFIPEVYVGRQGNRYTYSGGTSSGGVIVREEGRFVYSFHSHDPVSKCLCNSFDMVRLHKFGYLDDDFTKENPKPTDFPSYKEMEKLAMGQPEVRRAMQDARKAKIEADFASLDIEPEEEKPERGKGQNAGRRQDAGTSEFDLIRGTLETDRAGNVKASITAATKIIACHPELKGKVRFNEFTGNIDVMGDLPWHESGGRGKRTWSNNDDSNLRGWLDRNFGLSGKDKVADALTIVSTENRYHPVRDYLRPLKWDGTPRVEILLTDILGAEPTRLNREISKMMLRGAVARVMIPGIKFDYFYILVGPEGAGKSSLASILAGEWFSDSITSIEGKAGQEALRGVWIAEMSELIAVRKSEVESIKAFISKQVDKYRPAYGRVIEEYPRQCIMIGTTNNEHCLRGLEGNRRSPIVEIKPELRKVENPWAWLKENRDQIWAEAVRIFEDHRGEPLVLPNDLNEEIKQIQDRHNLDKDDTLFGEYRKFLEMPLPPDWENMLTRERIQYLRESAAFASMETDFGEDPLCDTLREELDSRYTRRQRITIPEILQEFLGMDKNDSGYKAKGREIGQFLNSLAPEWVSIGTRRTRNYGNQRVWKRK